MTQKVSFLEKIKIILKAISYHLFPESYESLKQFAAEARKRGFTVTIRELFIPNTNSQNSNDFCSSVSQCVTDGMVYLHLKGVGDGRKRDIVCDIPVGYCSLQYDDMKRFHEEKEKKMKEIMETLKSFIVPVKVQEIF
ncbi:MAG: hypothetical protein AB1333_01470 [Patescibacteria group bacterium]